MGPGSAFPDDVNDKDLNQAILLTHLQPIRNTPQQFKAGCETWAVAWSPDGSYFAWSCGNRVVKLVPWNRYKHCILTQDDRDSEGEHLEHESRTIDCGELVWSVAFGSSTAETRPHSTSLNWFRYKVFTDLVLATGLASGRIRTWNVRTGDLMLELLDHREVIRDLKFAPDGSMRLLSASRDGSLKVWDLQDDGNMGKTLRGNSKWVYGCAWSPDAKTICMVGDTRCVSLYETTKKYALIRKLEGHSHDVCSCDFSPDGALLMTASYDTQVIIWDPHTGAILKKLLHMHPPPSPIFAGGANGSYVRGVSFSHDGRHLASVADDGYVRFWDLFNDYVPEQVAQVSNALCAHYSPDGAVLAVGNRNGNVTMWLSPMHVSSLQHLCRMSIRRNANSAHVDRLNLPTRLKTFLKYQESTHY